MFDGFTLEHLDLGEVVVARAARRRRADPVVLLHGHPRTHTTWHAVAQRLADDARRRLPRPAWLRPLDAAAGRSGPRAVQQAGHGPRRRRPDDPARARAVRGGGARPRARWWRSVRRWTTPIGSRTSWSWTDCPSSSTSSGPTPRSPRPGGTGGSSGRRTSRPSASSTPTRTAGTALRRPRPSAPANHADIWAALRDPAVVHGMCEDYRAGLGIDRRHDEADRAAGRQIACPTLVARVGTRRHRHPRRPGRDLGAVAPTAAAPSRHRLRPPPSGGGS